MVGHMTANNVLRNIVDKDNLNAVIAALEHMPVAFGLFDTTGRSLFMNSMFRQFYGYTDPSMKVESFRAVLNKGLLTGWSVDPEVYFARMMENLASTGEHQDQVEVNGRILCIHDVLLEGGLILSTQKDMTERIKIEREIAYLASHDVMTGLANRASFEAQLAQAIAANSHAGRRFSVLMADLDRFKQINDTHGHPAGDDVLKEIACRFRASLGHNDFVARLGGDEFIFLCRADEESTRALASRLALAGQQPIRYDGTMLSVGVSVGYAVFPDHGQDQETLLRAADQALYEAKTIGHGTFMRYQPQDKVA